MAYIPSTLSLASWSSPVTILGSDNVALLDEAVNQIISTDAASLKNHANTELAKLPTYLSGELVKIEASATSATAASALAAADSAAAALASQNAAASSAAAASTSAGNASGSATAAAGSASAAATSEGNASGSATAAAGSASTATTKAGEASASATAAAGSETAAAGSASAASTSETNASGSASAAGSSATAAAASASAAATSETNAAASALEASTYADFHAATEKSIPVDGDEMPLVDSAASWGLKKIPWAKIKTALKTYFDTLYGGLAVANSWTAQQTFKELKETVFTLTGTSIDPANGTVQTKTLAGNTTFTEALESGQSVTLRIVNGATYTVTFPTTKWYSSAGNIAPTLTADDVIVFWKEGTTFCGRYGGNAV